MGNEYITLWFESFAVIKSKDIVSVYEGTDVINKNNDTFIYSFRGRQTPFPIFGKGGLIIEFKADSNGGMKMKQNKKKKEERRRKKKKKRYLLHYFFFYYYFSAAGFQAFFSANKLCPQSSLSRGFCLSV